MKSWQLILTFLTTLLMLISAPVLKAQEFNPPESLRLSEWCFNYNFLWSVPDTSASTMLYYNLYKDSEWIDSTLSRWCTVEFDSGAHTFGVSAVYDGGESEIISRELIAPMGKRARWLEITYNQDQVDLMWDSPCYYFWVSYMNNYVGGYYPSSATGPDSVTYAIKYPWNSDETFVAEFNEFIFIPAIYSGGGATGFHFKIFQGDSVLQMIYFQDLNQIQYNEWNYVVIDPPLLIPATGDLYVGVTILNDPDNGNLATIMEDDLQPEPGYGNLVSLDDSIFFQAGDGGDWVMMGFYTNALYYEKNQPGQVREAMAGYVNQYNIYRNGVYIGYSSEVPYTDTNFTSEDCGDYFEYYVVAQYNTCSALPSDTIGTILDCSNAVGELTGKDPVRIFPNPTNDFLYVETDFPVNEVILTSICGNDIFIEPGKSDQLIQIETSNLEQGIYLLRIKSQERIFAKKITVVH